MKCYNKDCPTDCWEDGFPNNCEAGADHPKFCPCYRGVGEPVQDKTEPERWLGTSYGISSQIAQLQRRVEALENK